MSDEKTDELERVAEGGAEVSAAEAPATDGAEGGGNPEEAGTAADAGAEGEGDGDAAVKQAAAAEQPEESETAGGQPPAGQEQLGEQQSEGQEVEGQESATDIPEALEGEAKTPAALEAPYESPQADDALAAADEQAAVVAVAGEDEEPPPPPQQLEGEALDQRQHAGPDEGAGLFGGIPAGPPGQSFAGAPIPGLSIRQYLDTTVVPVLRLGLRELVKSRPADPFDFLADYIRSHKPQ